VTACLFDVHGNLPALEAVLADLGEADRYILGGDYALMGAWPAGTVARLREVPSATWIRGNADRWLTEPPEQLQAAVDDARARLGDATEDEPELLERVTASRLMFGHTHLRFRRTACAVIHDGGRLEHRRVAYDHLASAAKVRSLGDWAEVMALRIERAEA
jgi:hypothetical protein